MIFKQIIKRSPFGSHCYKWKWNCRLVPITCYQLPGSMFFVNQINQLNKNSRISLFRSFSTSSSSKQDENEENPEDSSDCEDEKPIIPLLMNFMPLGMPNLFFSLKNFYLINVVIRNQIDKNFYFKDFIEGAKHALILVSSHLANNRLDDLKGLVEEKALEEIRLNYEKMTLAQRRELQLFPTDIVLAFAHHIDIQTLKEDFTGARKHIINFFIVFDCIRNLQETVREKAISNRQMDARELFQEFHNRKVICNYEFKREYIEMKQAGDQYEITKSDWIITKLLHINEKDFFRTILE